MPAQHHGVLPAVVELRAADVGHVQPGHETGHLAPRPVATARPSGHGDRRKGREGRRGGRDRDRSSEPRVSTGERPGGVVSQERLDQLREEHFNWDPASYVVEPVEGKKRFHDFQLPGELMHAIADLGFQYCSPIQALSLDAALEGRNVAGRAQTGTGKTAAYLVAILTRYLRSPEKRPAKGGVPRALVIAPTRELVVQIAKDAEALGKYCGLRCLAVYGGMDYDRQRDEVLDAPVDLLVATPGRLLDFTRGHVVDLSHVDTLVIDEADRMLDMGFIPDVRSIMHRLPEKDKRTTMLYSATLNEDIMKLASQWMAEPVRCEVEGDTVNTKAIKQIVYVVTANEKFTILFNHIMQYPDSRMIIFCNRRHTTEDVARGLSMRGVKCEVLSGDVNQNQRLRILEDFRAGKVRIVVATDVAGRGLHVDDIGFVINFDFPYEPEDYVHRIGRTGRAGATGVAISFADEDESFIIPDIEKFIGEELKCTMLQPDDPLLAKIPDRNGARRARREERAGARHGRRPRWDDGSLPKEAQPAEAVASDTPETTVAPAAAEAPAESAPAQAASGETPAPAPAEPVAEPVVTEAAAPESAPAETPAPAKEQPKKRTPFVKLFNEPAPETEAAESKEDQESAEGGQPRKAPLPPLCKPVYDKPWMVHDGETFRRGVPRQHQTVKTRVFDEEWKPGGVANPAPETTEDKTDE
ncbi:MAG: DEAD/DEAH box helicase [Kiritimatiellae bacterium]|nr:DEAD/DEAH box helicase [Kiritimatiellia bacterium]